MKNLKELILVFLCLVLLDWPYPSNASGVILDGQINKLIPLRSSATPLFKNSTDGNYTIVRFSVRPGETYTLDVNYPVDNQPRSIQIYGYNPISTSKKEGGFTDNFVSGFYWPCPPPPNCWLTQQYNIKVLPESSGSYLYVAIFSEKPGLQNSIFLRHPAIADEVVKSKRVPPLCRPLDGRYYCGMYNSKVFSGKVTKLFLMVSETDNLPGQYRPELNVQGQWQYTGDSGDKRVLELTQSGKNVKGLLHYGRAVAYVNGLVKADEVILTVTYNDPELISRWIPMKTAKQVVGIKSVFKLRPSEKPDQLDGLFYPWHVNWDSNKNLTKKYDGLQPGNPSNGSPYHYVLVKKRLHENLSGPSVNSGITIEAENEVQANTYIPSPSDPAYKWRSRELAYLPHSGTAYWYLSRQGDWLLYVFEVPSDGNYKLWVKDLNDFKHPSGARAVLVNIDCEAQFRVQENTSADNSGWGWHVFGTVYLRKGKHIMKVQKEKTTSAAAIIDAFYLTKGPEHPGM